MKIVAKIRKNEDGTITLIPPHNLEFKYDPDKEYFVDIMPYSSNRTLQQNKLMWKLLNSIAMKEDGNCSRVNELYCRMLETAHAKYTVIAIMPNAYDDFRRLYRHTIIEGKRGEYLMVKVFYGSSQMTTTEMSQLIDVIIDYAYKVGVEDIRAYEEMLEKNS